MSKITDAEANATSLDGLVNDNALVPTLRNGPKPSYQYLVDGWNDEIAATILEVNKSRGFRVVGTFEDGFTYELFNDVGIDADGNSWIYVGAGAPNKVVAAGTVPSVGDGYQQVTFNAASNVQMESGESVQKFNGQSRQAIEATYKAQGYNDVFFFEDGFTYTEPNDIGVYSDGTAWTYTGSLPITIASGTIPSTPDYEQVTFNDALMVRGAVIYVDTFSDLSPLIGPALPNGQRAITRDGDYTFNSITSTWEKSDYLESVRKQAAKAVTPEFYFQPSASASFVFDGSAKYNFDTVADYLANLKGVKAGFAVVTGLVGGISPMGVDSAWTDAEKLRSTINDLGHDLLNHGPAPQITVRTPLSAEMLELEVDQSYRDLRGVGVPIKGWVSYNSSLHRDNVSAVTRKHAIPFGSYAQVDARDFSNVTYGSEEDISDNRLVRAGLEAVIDENGTTILGSTAADVAEKLRIHKRLADYCKANNRHVVLYHHDVANGKFPLSEIGQLIDYYASIGVDVLSPAKQFQRISNVLTKEAKIEALEADVGELFSQESENLLDVASVGRWNQTVFSGTAPVVTNTASKTTSISEFDFTGGTVVGYLTTIEDVSSVSGGGGTLSFSFRFRSDVNDTYSAEPGAQGGMVGVLLQTLDAAGAVVSQSSKEYHHIDTYSRVGHISTSDFGRTDDTVASVRLRVIIKSGVARKVYIENPVMNRGSFPARYRHPEVKGIVNQTTQELNVGESWSPFGTSTAIARKVKRVIVYAKYEGQTETRGWKEFNINLQGTHQIVVGGGAPFTITFSLDEALTLTVDSITGSQLGRIAGIMVYI